MFSFKKIKENKKDKIIKEIKESFQQKQKPPQTTLDYYKLIKLLGKGSFGKVHLGKEILTDNFVAIKCIDKIYMKQDYSKMKILQEVLILKTLIHVNIIRLLEVFENSKKFFIVMEYASDGDLLTYMKENGTLDEETAKIIFR